jgi:hypothetical protein
LTNADAARILSTLAEQVALNNAAPFCGAIAFIPPEGDAVTFLPLMAKPDTSLFWTQVSVILKKTIDELDSQRDMYGRR